MINKPININNIKYIYKNYDKKLYNSIKENKVVIPVIVKIINNEYICIDGNKRLSVLKDLSLENDKYLTVICMIKNDFSKSGSSYWGNTRNKH